MDSTLNVTLSIFSMGRLGWLYVSTNQVCKCKTCLTLNVYECFNPLDVLRCCSSVFPRVTCCRVELPTLQRMLGQGDTRKF